MEEKITGGSIKFTIMSVIARYAYGDKHNIRISREEYRRLNDLAGQIIELCADMTPTLDKVLKVLNEVVKLDPKAAEALVETRVPCNKALADHPGIEVRAKLPESPDAEMTFEVGLLGVLNSFFERDDRGWPAIVAEWDAICPDCGELPDGCRALDGDPCPKCNKRTLVLSPIKCFRRAKITDKTT